MDLVFLILVIHDHVSDFLVRVGVELPIPFVLAFLEI